MSQMLAAIISASRRRMPSDSDADAYVASMNTARSGPDVTSGQALELTNFIRSLKGYTSTFYPGAMDVWSSLRVLAVVDPIYGVGEGTTLIPIIAGRTDTGLPVNAAHAQQARGVAVSSAPWSGYYATTSQYWQVPTPVAAMNWLTYTVCCLADVGPNGGVATVLSLKAGAEAVTVANTGGWRIFADGRVDGWGASNRINGRGTGETYSLLRMAMVRESLAAVENTWNRKYYRNNSSLPSTSTTAPTVINFGFDTGLGSRIDPFAVALFDRVLTRAERASVNAALERLRNSVITSGAIRLTATGTDRLLAQAGTTNLLLH